jgi:hypothetical protein
MRSYCSHQGMFSYRLTRSINSWFLEVVGTRPVGLMAAFGGMAAIVVYGLVPAHICHLSRLKCGVRRRIWKPVKVRKEEQREKA